MKNEVETRKFKVIEESGASNLKFRNTSCGMFNIIIIILENSNFLIFVVCLRVCCCVVLCCVVLCCVVLCCVVLCCVVLCCVVLFVCLQTRRLKMSSFQDMHRNSKVSSFKQDATTFKNEQFQDATELFSRGFSRCNKSENEQLQKPLFCIIFVVGWLVVGGGVFCLIQPPPKRREEKAAHHTKAEVLHFRVVLLGLLLLSVVLPSSLLWVVLLPSLLCGITFLFFFWICFLILCVSTHKMLNHHRKGGARKQHLPKEEVGDTTLKEGDL